MASLFDILGNSALRDVLGQLAGQTQASSRNFGNASFGPGNFGGLGEILGNLAGQARNVGSSAPGGMGGLLGAGAIGAILAQILPKGAVNTASLAGIGAVAWNFYKKWAQQQASGQTEQTAAQGSGWDDLFGESRQVDKAVADPTGMLLLRAMIYVAKADGHLDDIEKGRIEMMLQQMYPGQDVSVMLDYFTKETVDPAVLAREVQSREQGEDLYRLSCLIVDVDNFMERSYLNGLAQALGLDETTRNTLEREAEEAKQQLATL
ncbi:MAG: tellurite resistance TerB family protein [Desulfovibrio sp.]|nr:tellurite resistance TerB family protein [Desulfovibrio sp.]